MRGTRARTRATKLSAGGIPHVLCVRFGRRVEVLVHRVRRNLTPCSTPRRPASLCPPDGGFETRHRTKSAATRRQCAERGSSSTAAEEKGHGEESAGVSQVRGQKMTQCEVPRLAERIAQSRRAKTYSGRRRPPHLATKPGNRPGSPEQQLACGPSSRYVLFDPLFEIRFRQISSRDEQRGPRAQALEGRRGRRRDRMRGDGRLLHLPRRCHSVPTRRRPHDFHCVAQALRLRSHHRRRR